MALEAAEATRRDETQARRIVDEIGCGQTASAPGLALGGSATAFGASQVAAGKEEQEEQEPEISVCATQRQTACRAAAGRPLFTAQQHAAAPKAFGVVG